MPCHAILIPSFCPPPLQYTAARNDMPPPGKEEIRRPPMPAAAAARRTHGQSSILFMRVSPRGMYLPRKKKKGHQMTLGDRHSRKDGRNEKIRDVQKGRQAYIQVGQQPTPPPPPPVSCGIRACLVCNCTSPLARSSRPPHTQISGDSTAPSAPVDHPRTFVPGPCSGPGSMGMGWPKREGFETSIPLEQEGRTETRA